MFWFRTFETTYFPLNYFLVSTTYRPLFLCYALNLYFAAQVKANNTNFWLFQNDGLDQKWWQGWSNVWLVEQSKFIYFILLLLGQQFLNFCNMSWVELAISVPLFFSLPSRMFFKDLKKHFIIIFNSHPTSVRCLLLCLRKSRQNWKKWEIYQNHCKERERERCVGVWVGVWERGRGREIERDKVTHSVCGVGVFLWDYVLTCVLIWEWVCTRVCIILCVCTVWSVCVCTREREWHVGELLCVRERESDS